MNSGNVLVVVNKSLIKKPNSSILILSILTSYYGTSLGKASIIIFFPCRKWLFRYWMKRKIISLSFLTMSQTLFNLYLHNQWTNFHKLSYDGKPQMRAICTYVGCTKATTNDWDIRPSAAVKASSANISWMAEQICTIELALESAHQSIYNNIWCVSKQ